MKISIITVAHNAEATINDTISSVLAQQGVDIEYIIIDGNSTDDTMSIVNRYSGSIHKIISEPDGGIYHAMNKGIAIATGDIIGMLNADDIFSYDGYLQEMHKIFIGENADIVYADLVYVTQDNSKVVRHWRAGVFTQGLFRWGWMPPHPTVLVHRNVYQNAGVFNLNFKSAADYELLLRVFECGNWKIGYLPKIGVRMRIGGLSNSTFSARWRANQEDAMAWDVNKIKPFWITRFLKPLRKLVQYRF